MINATPRSRRSSTSSIISELSVVTGDPDISDVLDDESDVLDDESDVLDNLPHLAGCEFVEDSSQDDVPVISEPGGNSSVNEELSLETTADSSESDVGILDLTETTMGKNHRRGSVEVTPEGLQQSINDSETNSADSSNSKDKKLPLDNAFVINATPRSRQSSTSSTISELSVLTGDQDGLDVLDDGSDSSKVCMVIEVHRGGNVVTNANPQRSTSLKDGSPNAKKVAKPEEKKTKSDERPLTKELPSAEEKENSLRSDCFILKVIDTRNEAILSDQEVKALIDTKTTDNAKVEAIKKRGELGRMCVTELALEDVIPKEKFLVTLKKLVKESEIASRYEEDEYWKAIKSEINGLISDEQETSKKKKPKKEKRKNALGTRGKLVAKTARTIKDLKKLQNNIPSYFKHTNNGRKKHTNNGRKVIAGTVKDLIETLEAKKKLFEKAERKASKKDGKAIPSIRAAFDDLIGHILMFESIKAGVEEKMTDSKGGELSSIKLRPNGSKFHKQRRDSVKSVIDSSDQEEVELKQPLITRRSSAPRNS